VGFFGPLEAGEAAANELANLLVTVWFGVLLLYLLDLGKTYFVSMSVGLGSFAKRLIGQAPG